jgi:dihydrodipicolinate synthase/N-acetylneuraminate lyase
MIAGGLGEGYFLTREEHERLISAGVDAANGKVPIMTGIFDTCTKESAARAKTASDVGVDFLQVNPPHYMKPVDDEVFMHLEMINDATEAGLMVYNTPWAAMNFEIKPKLVERLLTLDHMVGLKWTSFDPNIWIDVLREFHDKLNIIDNSSMTDIAYQLGAKGYITLLGALAPKSELHLLSLLEGKKWDEFAKESGRLTAWRKVLGSAEELSYEGVGEGSMSKAVFEAAGKDFGPPLPPQRRIGKQTIEVIRKILADNGMFSVLEVKNLSKK